MYSINKFINSFNEWVGIIFSWNIIILCIIVVYEVVMRYIFNSPTIYNFELSIMIYGFHFMICAAFTLKHDFHVAIDVVHNLFSEKFKLIIDIIGYIMFFFPFTIIILYKSTQFAVTSWVELERSGSVWAPPVYYIKTVIPVTMLLLLLQGLSIIIIKVARLKNGDY